MFIPSPPQTELHYDYNYLGVQMFRLATLTSIPHGEHELRFEFEPTGKPDIEHGKGTPGRAQLYIDGKLAADRELPVTIPINIGITEGLTCGRDEGSPVSDSYEGPFPFTGRLDQVAIDVSGNLIEDREAQMRSIMSHQ